jgi:hypothetical protein
VRVLSELVLDYQRKDKSQANMEKFLNQADDSKQSGEQSKSSLINETENEEELLTQKVCRVITIVLKDNQDWKKYVKDVLEPIIELEKGKLCQQEGGDKDSNSSGFDNNIFDDEFINKDFNDPMEGTNEEEDDHHKFFKKMQECFSSTKGPDGRRGSSDMIEIEERDNKSKAYAENNNDVKTELRNSLCDEQNELPKFKRRDRSASNENFGLPPLSSFDDNKDLQDNENINQNYISNDESIGFSSNLAAVNSDLDL